jgi:hypothetical protein
MNTTTVYFKIKSGSAQQSDPLLENHLCKPAKLGLGNGVHKI